MKKIIKANLKLIIGFMLGAIVSGVGVYAATLNFASGDVEHTKSDGSKTNVKAALNELYEKAALSEKPKTISANLSGGAYGWTSYGGFQSCSLDTLTGTITINGNSITISGHGTTAPWNPEQYFSVSLSGSIN